MKYGWRERVSGAVIVIALGVIFIPLLLSEPEPRSERPQPVLTIEQPVQVPRTEVPEPQPPASLEELGAPTETPQLEQVFDEEVPVEEVAEPSGRSEATAESTPANEPVSDPIAELARAADQRLAESARRSQSSSAPASAVPGGEWAVQVGSFGEPGNAERLLEQLREEGFPAYSRPRDNNLTTVYAGPYDSSEAGERAMNELKSRINLQGLLVRERN
ncbi:SPOR domain-containing protein [Halomonas tibetensis]|uniref:SPOR domain-containing protein n=1 Tax=Halomonas tibetensis TaxID=2259590 RepID=A0ABV7B4J8_9GAMM